MTWNRTAWHGARCNRHPGLHWLRRRRLINRPRAGLRHDHSRRRCGGSGRLGRRSRYRGRRRCCRDNWRHRSLHRRLLWRSWRQCSGRRWTHGCRDRGSNRRSRRSRRLYCRRRWWSRGWGGWTHNRTSHGLWRDKSRCGGRWGRRCRRLGWWRCGCRRGRSGDRLGFNRRRNRARWRRRRRSGLLLLGNQFQHIARFGDVRQVDLGFDFVSFATVFRRARGRGLRLGGGAEVGPHLLCFMFFHGTGVRLLLGDADFHQHIENRFAFDFQLPGQIVNSNLTHPPFLCPAPLLKSS